MLGSGSKFKWQLALELEPCLKGSRDAATFQLILGFLRDYKASMSVPNRPETQAKPEASTSNTSCSAPRVETITVHGGGSIQSYVSSALELLTVRSSLAHNLGFELTAK